MKKISKSTSFADQAFEILKESILLGELKAGDPLPEEKYSKQLGISRTPFRDTLTRLDAEGLIIQRNGAPAVVASFTKEKSLEYMELRQLLEVSNIEKVMSIRSSYLVRQLKETLALQKASIEDDRYADFMKYDKKFHLILVSQNPNAEFKRWVEKLNTDLSRAFLILSKTAKPSASSAYEEHCEIVRAIENQDSILAKNKMIVHLNNVEQRFLDYYQDSAT